MSELEPDMFDSFSADQAASQYKGGSTPGMNQALGLPFGKMEKTLVAFDVDGTLINGEFEKYGNMLQLLVSFTFQKWKNVDVIVWSGGGAAYAELMISRTLGIDFAQKIRFYSKLQYLELREKYQKIVAFDDIQDTALGDVNLIPRNK